jgi:hypothetical protein
VETVALRGNGGVLYAVEVAADLFIAVDAVIEVGDKRGYGAFEVDVVFPERVVGVYEEGLSCRVTGGFEVGIHWLIIERLVEGVGCSGCGDRLAEILQIRCL